MVEIKPSVAPYPGAVRLQPWHADGAMNAYFYNRGRILLPGALIPDGKPHAFRCGGLNYYYVADVDERTGPHVLTFLDNVPLPFYVGLRCQPERPDLYVVRCAECVRRWADEVGPI
jgi:hypothetical protein